MPTVNNRRLLPLNGVMPMDDTPGGDKDPNKENRKPTDNEVPQEDPQEESDPSDEEKEEASEYESEDSSSGEDGSDDEDLMLWTKETLVRSIKFCTKKYNKVKEKCEQLMTRIEKLTTEKTNLRVSHQVTLTSKNTMIANLRNQLRVQSETKAAVRHEYQKKFEDDRNSWKDKAINQRKVSADLQREVTKLEKENKKFATEKENAKRKANAANLDYVESNKQVTQLKNENKRLKKDLDKKTKALEKVDEAKIQAQVEIEKEKTERKKVELAEKAAQKLIEQQLKDLDYQKKKELSQHQSEIRIQEKAKQRQKKEEDDKEKIKEQNERINSQLTTVLRSAPAARQTLPNNGQFLGANNFIQLLQTAQQMFAPQGNTLPSTLLQLGAGTSSGSSGDDAISLVTQPPGLASPPTQRQLTLTQMERERTPSPPERPLPRGVQKLTDDASGEKYYVVKERDGSKSIYMSYEELMDALNSKTGESTYPPPRRRNSDRSERTAATAAQVTPATLAFSQMSDLTMTQRTEYPKYPAMSQRSLASLEGEACDSDSAADTASEEDDY